MFGDRKNLISKISYFPATTIKPSDQVKMEEEKVKEVTWRRGRWRRDS